MSLPRRQLRPRATEALRVPALFVTDLSAPAVVGLEARAFRELVADLAIPHLRRGHRLLVDVDVFRAAVGAAATHSTDAASEVEPKAKTSIASGLLARLGRERV